MRNLSLQNNALYPNDESVPVGSFIPLVNLTSLYLYGMNLDVKYATDEICKYLHSLEELKIDIWDRFQISQSCTNLRNLKRLTLNVRQRIRFTNSSLEVLEGLPIEALHLQGTGTAGYYKPLESDFLRPLSSLKILQIDSFSVCYISYLLRTIIYPLQNKTMDLTFNDFRFTPIQTLSSVDLQYLKNICVRKLVLTKVNMDTFHFWTLMQSRLWHCLEEFDASENYIVDNIPIFFGLSLPRIEKLNLCCQLTRQVNANEESVGNEIQISNESKYVIAAGLEFYVSDTLKMLSFEKIDLRDQPFDYELIVHANGIEKISIRNFNFRNCIGALKGFKNLKVLTMEGWNCAIINPDFISNFTSVRELTFSSMHFGHNAKTMVSLLANWAHLTYIDLSNNFIEDIHHLFFMSQLDSLKNVSLANNLLTFIPKAVMSLKDIRYIDLSHNLISSLSNEEMEFIEERSDLTIKLGDNVFQCTCTTIPFLSWLQRHSHQVGDFTSITCMNEENIKRNLSVLTKELRVKQLKCASKTALYFAVFGSIFLILCVILTFTLVKFQADVHYIFARIRRHFRSKTERLQCKEKYHAFVSYGNTNYHWTVWEMKPKLEKEGFRLMYPDFHFNLGEYDSENILDAIDNSRRIIFVITRDFLTDEWCEHHMQVARCHAFRKQSDNFIIVIIRDNIPLHEIPKSLQRIWIRVNCLRWPLDGDDEDVRLFWKKLKNDLIED